MASATSELESEVLAPSSNADPRRACSSSSVELEIAPTFRICVSKSIAESVAFFSPTVANPAAAVSTAVIFPPRLLRLSPADCNPLPMDSADFPTDSNALLALSERSEMVFNVLLAVETMLFIASGTLEAAD